MDVELQFVDGQYELITSAGTIRGASIEELTEIVGVLAVFLESAGSETVSAQGDRSGAWGRVRREHIEKHDACEACGCKKSLFVHHIIPFHKKPELELDPDNLITLCFVCHFWFGHLKNWRSHNDQVLRDSRWYREKLAERPI